MNSTSSPHVAVIGAGFCGLAAAYELTKRGIKVSVFESENEIGGLAGSFLVEGVRLEKFYHHWFNNDQHIIDLITELGCQSNILLRPTRTGMYFANQSFRLSTPLDLLRFSALPWIDRIRLGLLALRARRVQDWRELEDLSAEEWLRSMGGDRVYEVVWEPLLRGKFGDEAAQVSAVWFWNKLKLRGGSRGKAGEEQLAYYKGGFIALADRTAKEIRALGGAVHTNAKVDSILVEGKHVRGITISGRKIDVDAVLATPALPIVAELLKGKIDSEYLVSLHRIRYLANVCLVLELDRSLSDLYWINVADPDFPFVGVIEHTNFEPSGTYGGRNIVYLSKYLPESHELYEMDEDTLLDFALPHIKRMFPQFQQDWILGHHVWRARYAQPVVEKHYSSLIPKLDTPIVSLFLASMAQVYPEDRGTNYAVRDGRAAGAHIAQQLLVA